MNSFSSLVAGQNQLSIEDLFRGSDYSEKRDGKRLGDGYQRTLEIMKDGQWHSPNEIAHLSKNRLDSSLRYVRYLKKAGYTVEKKYDHDGLYLYRAISNS